MYKLYVDDMREPFSADWVVCKSVNEAMELIDERGHVTAQTQYILE